MKKWVLVLFVVVAVVQLGVPAFMIARHERTLAIGEKYFFECGPVDPVDAFRGRYVALRFVEDATTAVAAEEGFVQGETAYAEILVVEGEGDFARLGRLFREAPEGDGDYLKVEVDWGARGEGKVGEEVDVILPFDRYYMEEEQAKQADKAYRELMRLRESEREVAEGGEEAGAAETRQSRSHVAVRVRDGYAVLEQLYLDGVEVREYLKEFGGEDGE